MFEHAIDDMVRDFGGRLEAQGMSLDIYLQYTGMDMDAFRASFKEQAERQTKIRLALEKIASLENITATEEEINAEYEKLAKNYGLEADKIKNFIPSDEIAKDVAMQKAIDFVRDNAEITKKAARKPAAKKAAAADGEAEKKPAAKKTTTAKKTTSTAAKKTTTTKKTTAKKDAE